MHALIVLAHPNPSSLTHAVAAQVADGIARAGHSAEIADLAAEDFDPRFSLDDVAVHRRKAPPSADVQSEQARIDRADALVLVFPVYWWSMPGLLKGWIDRVFANGWAYDEAPGVGLVKLLRHLPVHLVGIGGADTGTFERHGYFGAMRTQIDHGIFDYCGARVVSSRLLLDSDREPARHLEAGLAIGCNVFAGCDKVEAA